MSLKTAVVDGASMAPTLKSGQRMLASKASLWFGGVHDGDIVVIKDWDPSGGYVVKRVYRTAGQKVDSESAPFEYKVDLTEATYRVPQGNVYVLGDNRGVSEDSRVFGPVPLSQVVAKVVLY